MAETIKLKARRLVNAVSAIQELRALQPRAKLGFQLAKLGRVLLEAFEPIEVSRKELVARYDVADVESGPGLSETVKNAFKDFRKEWNELLDGTDIDVEIDEKVKISPNMEIATGILLDLDLFFVLG